MIESEPDSALPDVDSAAIRSVTVTGAAGFVGSHLVQTCLALGWSVTAVDGFTDYYSRALKEANVAQFRDHPACTFVEGDLLELDLKGLLRDANIVFHLAAQPGVRASWGEGFGVYERHNVIVLQRLLEAARKCPPQRLVFASSSSVYGDAEKLPTPEDVILRPVSPYGVTKATGEQLARLYHGTFGVPVVILRYFSVYGPRQRPDMAFHRLITASLTGRRFTVLGDGAQTRDFTYVTDAVAGTVSAGLRGVPGAAYNLGGGSQRSMCEVFLTLEKIAGKPLDLEFTRSRAGDAKNTSADVSLARRHLLYAPMFSFRDGLTSQFEWQRDQHGALTGAR